jgi:uncharacterized membrane protein YfcA
MLNDILLILIASATSTLTAITGVGGGMMLIAIMPGFLPPAAIVPVHATVQLFSNSSRALFGWQFLRWEFVLGFVAGAIAGGLFAAGITREINLWGPGIRLRLPPAGEFIVIGALQTGLSMIVGATGPLGQAALIRRQLRRDALVVTAALMMSFTHLIKIVLFALLGFSFLAYWKIILGMSLGVIAGAWMGTRIRYRIPEDPFRKILRWLLTLLALRMIYITLF